MSAQAAKLMVDSFYEKMMEDLDRLPVNTQEWIKWMQETFNGIVCNDPWALRHVPYFLKTKEMCIRTVEENPWQLKDVPDNFKTQEIYDKAVRSNPSSLSFILTTLKHRRRATKQSGHAHTPCGMFLIASLPKKCVRTRQYFSYS